MRLQSMLNQIVRALQNRFRKGLRTRDAIGLSLILHLLLGMALMSFFIGTLYVEAPLQQSSLELELVSESSSPLAANQRAGTKSVETAGNSRKHAASSDTHSQDRQSIMLASLGSLSDLRDSFKFISHEVTGDSLGLSPLQGRVPSTAFYGAGDGSESGLGHGGFGISVCTAPSPQY